MRMINLDEARVLNGISMTNIRSFMRSCDVDYSLPDLCDMIVICPDSQIYFINSESKTFSTLNSYLIYNEEFADIFKCFRRRSGDFYKLNHNVMGDLYFRSLDFDIKSTSKMTTTMIPWLEDAVPVAIGEPVFSGLTKRFSDNNIFSVFSTNGVIAITRTDFAGATLRKIKASSIVPNRESNKRNDYHADILTGMVNTDDVTTNRISFTTDPKVHLFKSFH